MSPSTKENLEFLWGAATSAHQVEGNNVHSDWWAWEKQGNIEGGAESGRTTDHWNRFDEDLRYAKDIGLNSYRFSMEWAKIEPKQGTWDKEAIERYHEIIQSCEKYNLTPFVTLHHFTSPAWFAEQGGFHQRNPSKIFEHYVAKMVREYGAKVPYWVTINEPMVLAIGGYLGQFMPPALVSPKQVSHVCRNLFKCHVKAYDLIHSATPEKKGPWKNIPTQVGIAHNMVDFLADRPLHPIENAMKLFLDSFYNRSWLDAVLGKKQHFWVPGIVPSVKQLKRALGKRTADFIGINYYTKAYLRFRPKDAFDVELKNLPIGVAFARRNEPQSDLNWAIHPKGLSKMIHLVKKYGLPIYLTENGIADKDDKMRPSFLVAHLQEVAKQIEQGADIRGYFYWSLLDNFEWIKGFWPRFGLLKVNYETFEREMTESAHLYQKLISKHKGMPPNMDIIKKSFHKYLIP